MERGDDMLDHLRAHDGLNNILHHCHIHKRFAVEIIFVFKSVENQIKLIYLNININSECIQIKL